MNKLNALFMEAQEIAQEAQAHKTLNERATPSAADVLKNSIDAMLKDRTEREKVAMEKAQAFTAAQNLDDLRFQFLAETYNDLMSLTMAELLEIEPPAAPPAAPIVETWNTGNLYTAHGQRIAATRLIGGKYAFLDLDRGISGILTERDKPENLSAAAFVGSQYRAGNYTEGLYIQNRPYAEARELENLLHAAAMTAPSLKKSAGQ
jgi:hypothetical protein